MSSSRFVIALAFLSLFTTPAHPATIYVPADYPTIQEAIDASSQRDEIIVAAGTWSGDKNHDLILNHDVVLRSENGPADCIIDCEDAHRFVQSTSNLTRSTLISGFTVLDGQGDAGGAIFISPYSSPIIRNCVFQDCVAMSPTDSDGGGAIKADSNATPSIEYCTFSGNQSMSAGGGAISASDKAGLSIHECVFEDNVAHNNYAGGAILTFSFSGATIDHCAFRNNQCASWGGAITFIGNGVLKRIDHCVFENNQSYEGGALASLSNARVTVIACEFRDNVAQLNTHDTPAAGGAAAVEGDGATLRLTNCLFTRNLATNDGLAGSTGGAVYAADKTTTTISDCTFSRNHAAGRDGSTIADGGALFVGQDATVTVANTVLWGDSADQQGQEIAFGDDAPSSLTVSYSDVTGGADGVYDGAGSLHWNAGNIDADPRFGNADAGDFTLAAGSPGIDAGDNTAVPSNTTIDLADRHRFVDDPDSSDSGRGAAPVVDMGAYEFFPPPPPTHTADMNCDSVVDFADIDGFVSALISRYSYESVYPNCNWLNADIDGDSSVTAADVDGFVECLISDDCS